MKCKRCLGFMVPEWCSELFIEAYVMRCVNCGAIVDPTISKNQQLSQPGKCAALVAS